MNNPFSNSLIKEPVYHGTSGKFDKFKTGVETSRAVLFAEFKVKSQGIFFSSSFEDAKSYGKNVVKCWVNLTNPLFNPNSDKAGQPGRETYHRFSKEKEQDFVKIFSPLAHETDIDGEKVPVIDKMLGQIEVRDVRFSSRSEETYPEWIYELLGDGGIIWDVMDDEGVVQRMKALGYDGTFVNEPNDHSGSSVFVVSPEQIKIIEWGDNDLEESQQESKGFTYGLTLRPAGIGAAPEGYTYNELGSYDDSGERDRTTRHGTVTYPSELSDEQIKQFELVPIHNEAYLKRWIEKAWAKLGKYAHKYLEMGGEEALSEQMRSMADRFGPIHPKEYEQAEKEIIARAKGEKIEEVVAYHGTDRIFRKFDKSAETRNTKEYGPGHYFSMSAEDASNYAGDDAGANVHIVDIDDRDHKFWNVSDYHGFVEISDKLGLKNREKKDKKYNWFSELVSLIGDQFFKEAIKEGSSSAFLAKKLREMGYSGVIIPKEYNGGGRADWYVVYDDSAISHKFAKNVSEKMECLEKTITESVQSDREIRWLADILMNSLIRNVKRNKQFNGAATNTGQFKDSKDWIELEDFMNEWNISVVMAQGEVGIDGSWTSSQKTIYLSEPQKDDGLRTSLHEFVRTKLSETLDMQIKTRYMDVLVHELTHAFDDFRSKGKFKKDSYKSPTSGGGDSEYWLQQIEINARFAETAQALVSKKLSLDSGTQKGFQNYMEVFQSAIRKWEIMPEWVKKRLQGRMYKEYSELSNQEKDIILVKEGWSPLTSALDYLAKGKTKELPDEIAWTSADYRFKGDKAYTTNQIHTFSQILKKAINNPDEYKKNMRWVNYVIEGVQSAISKNPEVVGYIQDYFKLSDDEIESIRNSTAWMESKDSFIKNFIKENTDENGFKIVDYSETLYHGSTTPVSKFSLSGDGRMGKGLYLTTDKDWAEFYAQGGRQGKSGQKLSDKQGHIYQFKVEGKAAVVTDEQEFLDYIRSNYEPMEDEFSKWGDWSNAVVAHVSGWAKEEGIDIVVSPGEGILTAFPQVLVVSDGVAKPKKKMEESFLKDFIHQHYDKKWGEEPEDFGFISEDVNGTKHTSSIKVHGTGNFLWLDPEDNLWRFDSSTFLTHEDWARAYCKKNQITVRYMARDVLFEKGWTRIWYAGHKFAVETQDAEKFLKEKLPFVVFSLDIDRDTPIEIDEVSVINGSSLPFEGMEGDKISDFVPEINSESTQEKVESSEGAGTLTLWHGGKAGLDKLSVQFTKSKIFGNAIYFTDSYESAKKYATERYGKDGVVYRAKVSLNNITHNPTEFRNDASYDSLVFKLNSGEINYAVKNDEQVLSLEKVGLGSKSESKLFKHFFEENHDLDFDETDVFDNIVGLGRMPNNQDVDSGYKGYVVYMSPDKFLSLAAKLNDPKEDSLRAIKEHLQNGGKIAKPLLHVRIDSEENNLGIVSHEGRHRVKVLSSLYGKDISIPVQIYFTRHSDLEDFKKEHPNYKSDISILVPEDVYRAKLNFRDRGDK